MAAQKQTTLNRYQALFLVLLAAVGFIIYSNTLGTPFIFDDVTAIKDNPSIRMTEFSGRQILHAAVGYAENRPVSMLSFALNYYFGKYNPAGYHLVNIFIHIVLLDISICVKTLLNQRLNGIKI